MLDSMYMRVDWSFYSILNNYFTYSYVAKCSKSCSSSYLMAVLKCAMELMSPSSYDNLLLH